MAKRTVSTLGELVRVLPEIGRNRRAVVYFDDNGTVLFIDVSSRDDQPGKT
jgi:hypothetical protein